MTRNLYFTKKLAFLTKICTDFEILNYIFFFHFWFFENNCVKIILILRSFQKHFGCHLNISSRKNWARAETFARTYKTAETTISFRFIWSPKFFYLSLNLQQKSAHSQSFPLYLLGIWMWTHISMIFSNKKNQLCNYQIQNDERLHRNFRYNIRFHQF